MLAAAAPLTFLRCKQPPSPHSLLWGFSGQPGSTVYEWGVIKGRAHYIEPSGTVCVAPLCGYLPCPDPSPEVPADGCLHDIGDGWSKASFNWQG